RNIAIRIEVKDNPEIWADAGQLQQVFYHLIQNAEQAMAAARRGGTVTIRVGRSTRGVRVEVADQGPGIPPEHLPRIFNPFFTTKPPGEGRGLGLSVAHSIVAEHDGRIWAENVPDGGALLVVELPIGTPTSQPEVDAPLTSA